jgi:hypothetical protein
MAWTWNNITEFAYYLKYSNSISTFLVAILKLVPQDAGFCHSIATVHIISLQPTY